ncbi:MAG: hypothetical protein WBB27_13250 [Maribacter sp.]
MKLIPHYRTHLLTACFLLSSVLSFSQGQGLEWQAESNILLSNETEVMLTSNLTKQGSVFTWEQIGYNTSETITFNVSSTTGNWNAQNSTGELNYVLNSTETTATLTLDGNQDGVIAILIINGENAATTNSYTFYIETLTNL